MWKKENKKALRVFCEALGGLVYISNLLDQSQLNARELDKDNLSAIGHVHKIAGGDNVYHTIYKVFLL